jgi:hypothetical protein
MPGDDLDGSTNPAPSWAGDAAEAGPAQPAPAVPASQMPLFDAADLAPARSRTARLQGRIKALMSSPSGRPPAAEAGSSWPDSFFDVNAGP